MGRPVRLTPEQQVFLTERHLATLTTLRPDGSPHVVPVAFTWDPAGVARITTSARSVKVRNIDEARAAGRPARGALCQVSGGRWLTLEGELEVCTEHPEVAEAERRHAVRYPRLDPDPTRVVLRLHVDRVLGSDYMTP